MDAFRRAGKKSILFVNDDDRAQKILRKRSVPFSIYPIACDGEWEANAIAKYSVSLWLNDRMNTAGRHADAVLATGIPLATMDDLGSGAELAALNILALAHPDQSPPGLRVCCGLSYIVLDPNITQYRRQRNLLNSIVISLGGSDTHNLTNKITSVIASNTDGIPITVVLGPAYEGTSIPEQQGLNVKRFVPDLAEEFAQHDLAITAGGLTAFEAAAAGLPIIVIAAEPHEIQSAALLTDIGAAEYGGFRDQFDRNVFQNLRNLPLSKMSNAGLANIKLSGASSVCGEILSLAAAKKQ